MQSAPCPPKWKAGEFHKFMCDIFPEHRTPFNRLDVARIGEDIGKSYESVYRMLRTGKLSVENAKLLHEAAANQANVAALAKENREPPKLEDFTTFIFA